MARKPAFKSEEKTANMSPEQIIREQEKIIERQSARIKSLVELRKQPSLDEAFRLLTQQLCSEMDGDEDGYLLDKVPSGIDDAADEDKRTSRDGEPITGHALPSNRDMGLNIVLSQLTQTIHNQLHGRDGGKGALHYYNMYREQKDSPSFQERWAKKQLHRDDLKLLNQLRIQRARVTYLQLLKDTFQGVFQDVTRTQWKPYVAPSNAAGEPARPFSEADLEKLMRL